MQAERREIKNGYKVLYIINSGIYKEISVYTGDDINWIHFWNSACGCYYDCQDQEDTGISTCAGSVCIIYQMYPIGIAFISDLLWNTCFFSEVSEYKPL